MTDLWETVEWLDHQPHAEAFTAAQILRKYLEGEQVQWCETHRQVGLPEFEWVCCKSQKPYDCSIVPKLLVRDDTARED